MELHGVGVGQGVAVGPVLRMPPPLPEPAMASHAGDAHAEFASVTVALAAVAEQLRERCARVAEADGRTMLEAAAQMAEDPTLVVDVRARIDAGSTGERAVFDAFAAFQSALAALGGVMAERQNDLADVAQRIIAQLRGVAAPGVPHSNTPYILVAADLAPADTALLDLTKVLALVTVEGGPTSHTAILARSRSIPAIVGVAAAAELSNDTIVLVDAAANRITVAPSAEAIAEAHARSAQRSATASAHVTKNGLGTHQPGMLKDGTAIALLANLSSPAEAAEAVALGAEGVGLFRTEFLFLNATTAPSVDEQRRHYSALLSHFGGKKVVVRVLDAGADKPLRFLAVAHEQNPALGVRGLRALRANENVLRDQLTALAQAQAENHAELWVMAPMVTDAEEVDYFVALSRELGLSTVGVMAEVPSIAMLVNQVFETADFVSIGTNDLSQYTLAADRMLGSLAHFHDPWHPAILRLVKLIGDAGLAAAKPVGVCGEAAADPQLAVVLVGLGATTLSMTPAALADVRAELTKYTLAEAQQFAVRAINARTAAAARAGFAAG